MTTRLLSIAARFLPRPLSLHFAALLLLDGCSLLAGAGDLRHTTIHTVVHGTLTSQLSSAGVSHPEPVAEAFEYYALGEQVHSREFLATACAENSPDQLRAAVHVLQDVAPSLGSYASSVQTFVGTLSCVDPATQPDASATPAPTAVADHGGAGAQPASQCRENLGLEGESCGGSPQCVAGLGCIGGVCRARPAPPSTAVQNAPPESDPSSPPPTPVDPSQGSGVGATNGVRASISNARIAAILAPALRHVRRCAPGLSGILPVTIDVSAEGSVERAYAGDANTDPAVAACIHQIVIGLTFPRSTQEHQTLAGSFNLGHGHRAAHPRRH